MPLRIMKISVVTVVENHGVTMKFNRSIPPNMHTQRIFLCWEATVTGGLQTGGFQTGHCNIEKRDPYFFGNEEFLVH